MKVSEAIELLDNMPPDMEVDIVLLPGIKKPKKPKNGASKWDRPYFPPSPQPYWLGQGHGSPSTGITCKTVH